MALSHFSLLNTHILVYLKHVNVALCIFYTCAYQNIILITKIHITLSFNSLAPFCVTLSPLRRGRNVGQCTKQKAGVYCK